MLRRWATTFALDNRPLPLRRRFYAVSLLTLLLLETAPTPGAPGPDTAPARPPVPVVHCTDLFRPHVDPDDHWDLACVFALAFQGAIDLRGVVIDFPPANRPEANPDIAAVAQLNYITGLNVPVAIGPSREAPKSAPRGHQGINLLLNVLRAADRPVVIHVVGSCLTMAAAVREAPDLFRRKCAGVYLNAGTGAPDPSRNRYLEYNVTLDPTSYAAMFALPCPIYWMPCFEDLGTDDKRIVREYGTHYTFRQGEILSGLSPRMQNYFLYMLTRKQDANWLKVLWKRPDPRALATFSKQIRHMWCTAGFLHAAGETVTAPGEIVARAAGASSSVFAFEPVAVRCSEDGQTSWKPASHGSRQFIFHVRDTSHYAQAMTRAMTTLLERLP